MTEGFTTRLLLPAAGFGKRVGSPKAKELLQLYDEELPLIEWSLQLALKFQLQPLVITRSDKIELNEYLESVKNKYNLEICKISDSKEWPDTILKSEEFWFSKNIVVLPDTRFQPEAVIREMSNELERTSYTFATFKVEDLKTWGAVRNTNEGFYISEKPHLSEASDQAWGVFGFQKQSGRRLLEAMLTSDHQFKWVSKEQAKLFDLLGFEDKTRDGLGAFINA